MHARTTCPRLSPDSETAGTQNTRPIESQVRRPNHRTIPPNSFQSLNCNRNRGQGYVSAMAVSGRGSRRPGGQMSDRGELQSIVVASSTWSESSRTLRRDFKGISVALNGEPRFTLGRSYRTHTPDSSVAYMCLPLHRSTNNTHTPRHAVFMSPTTPEQIHADSR